MLYQRYQLQIIFESWYAVSMQKFTPTQSHSHYLFLKELLSFPTDPANPLCPVLNIVPFEDLVYGVVLARKLFVGRHTVHKAMARATQPSDAVQHPLFMPATLEHFGMDFSRDQMVVGQRDPVPVTYLAGIDSRRGPGGRAGCDRGNVVC